MKQSNKIVQSIFSFLFFSAYLSFSLITIQNCNPKQKTSTSDRLVENKQKAAESIKKAFNAELFSCNASSVLRKTAILDTLILGVSKQGKDYFLKACVLTQCSEKYYTKLKCDISVIEKFNKTKTNRAFLAARIERIDKLDVSAYADSLDGNVTELALGKSILLTGECLEISEISATLN